MMPTIKAVLLAALFCLQGCTNLDYYLHSIGGQMKIWGKERPIKDVLADPATPAALKQKLAAVLRIRDFASAELRLPDNDSYRTYADIERPYVAWNVFTAPELSAKLKEWCFVVAGCVSYRGYFSHEQAKAFAEELRRQGYDVYVGGVTAYSTLGWFRDPLLNTVTDRSEVQIAALLFHELAHQLVYVRGDSMFNESFATAVEIEGVRRWLTRTGASDKLAVYMKQKKRDEAFVSMVRDARGRLAQLYDLPLSDADKRVKKAAILQELRAEYQRFKGQWQGYGGYDRWFEQDLNNAQLASLALYTQWVPAFQAMLAEHTGDLTEFYRRARRIGGLSVAQRAHQLNALPPPPMQAGRAPQDLLK